MNKQRKVLITITYNEMGIIIDTKTEELGSSAQLGTNLASLGTDCISRQVAVDMLMERASTLRGTVGDLGGACSGAAKLIMQMPSAEPKRGKWIYGEDSTADCVDGYRCDQCGFFVPWDYTHKSIDYIKDYNFCPKCGRRMEVTE